MTAILDYGCRKDHHQAVPHGTNYRDVHIDMRGTPCPLCLLERLESERQAAYGREEELALWRDIATQEQVGHVMGNLSKAAAR